MIRLALVEDDPDDRDIFVSLLKKSKDFRLHRFFESGDALLEMLTTAAQQDFPDLILLDHNMPRVTGFQILQELKANRRYAEIPVVICSTYVSAAMAEQCRSAGALEVFGKPLTAEGYNEILNLIIAKWAPFRRSW